MEGRQRITTSLVMTEKNIRATSERCSSVAVTLTVHTLDDPLRSFLFQIMHSFEWQLEDF